jgi:hypothetical protein
MPRSNGKHLLIANSYTLHLISLRFGDSAYPPPEPSAKPARTEEEPRRWRAYLTVGEEDEPEKVIVYCPDCAKRKFDQTIADRRRVRHEHRPLPLSPRCDPQRSDFSACRADGIGEEFAVVGRLAFMAARATCVARSCRLRRVGITCRLDGRAAVLLSGPPKASCAPLALELVADRAYVL